MKVEQPLKSFAIIIAIEDYRFSDSRTGISSVKYAKNDAIKFKELLKSDFGVLEDEVILWTDKEATKSALEQELSYHIRNLSKNDKFYFYYAGHGFYKGGNNKLTCWDTHPENLDGTTVSLKDILLDPLLETECDQSLLFLDCCAAYLKDSVISRDLISNLSHNELEEFLDSKTHHAIFMSCSPGQKSYPSELLKHGIWTWHLIDALKGNAKDAILKDKFITDATLKNYLSTAIPKFITKETSIKSTQNPYAKISASNDFIIKKIIRPEEEINNELPKLNLEFQSAILRSTITISVKRAMGFKELISFQTELEIQETASLLMHLNPNYKKTFNQSTKAQKEFSHSEKDKSNMVPKMVMVKSKMNTSGISLTLNKTPATLVKQG